MRGSIKRRGKGILLRLPLGRDPVTKKQKFHTRTVHVSWKEAERILAGWVSDFEAGRPLGRSKDSLNTVIKKWLEQHSPNIAPRTAYDYGITWKTYIKDDIGELPIATIRTVHLQEFLQKLQTQGVRVYLYKSTVVLRQVFKYALRMELIPANPMLAVEPPKISKSVRGRTFQPEEIPALLKAAQGDPFEAYWHVLVVTGCRPGEGQGLRWEDLFWDEERPQIRIEQAVSWVGNEFFLRPPKTAKSRRTIDVPPQLMDVLKEHRKRQIAAYEAHPPEVNLNLVFPGPTGRPMDPANLRERHWKPLLKRAGLNPKAPMQFGFRMYDLRHTAISLLLEDGEQVINVASYAGHSSPRMVEEVYAKVIEKARKRPAKRMAKLIYLRPELNNVEPGSEAVDH